MTLYQGMEVQVCVTVLPNTVVRVLKFKKDSTKKH